MYGGKRFKATPLARRSPEEWTMKKQDRSSAPARRKRTSYRIDTDNSSISSHDSLPTRRDKLMKESFNEVEDFLYKINNNYEETYVQFVQSAKGQRRRPYNTLVKFNGNGEVYVMDDADTPCIEINVYNNIKLVTLSDYYNDLKGDCKKDLDHASFFVLLDFFSYIYKSELVLTDVSRQETDCVHLSKNMLRLAKQRTFYNRYGFTNPSFDDVFEKLAVMPLVSLLDEYTAEKVQSFFEIKKDTLMHEFAKEVVKNVKKFCRERPLEFKHCVQAVELVLDNFLKREGWTNYLELIKFKKPRSTVTNFPYVNLVETGEEKPAFIVTFYYTP
jgi:hypothetical protein